MDKPVSNRRVGIEFRKCVARWQREGLMERYMSGENVLDIGFKGGDPEAVPVTENAIGIGLDYPGYDGRTLPFDDESQDAVFASAVLEHIPDHKQALSEWYRVTKIGGHIIIFVPNRFLYEQRPDLPGRWNGDHRRLYTPASLLCELEQSFPPNGFRVRHLLDADEGFDYGAPLGTRPRGNYMIEAVIEKITIPPYTQRLIYPPSVRRLIDQFDQMVFDYLDGAVADGTAADDFVSVMGKPRYFTPWRRLEIDFILAPPPKRSPVAEDLLRSLVQPIIELIDVDVEAYVKTYLDLSNHPNPTLHWHRHGFFEGRLGSRFEFELDRFGTVATPPLTVTSLSEPAG